MIPEFKGKYYFLSNFFPAIVNIWGYSFPTSEHAFQAGKSLDAKVRSDVLKIPTPWEVKKFGRKIRPIRPDWERVKVDVMNVVVRRKFSDNIFLAHMLLETGDQELIEGNTWGDQFWGTVNGRGTNHLGKILMEVRQDLKCQWR
jgi:hypothetical protein